MVLSAVRAMQFFDLSAVLGYAAPDPKIQRELRTFLPLLARVTASQSGANLKLVSRTGTRALLKSHLDADTVSFRLVRVGGAWKVANIRVSGLPAVGAP